ncbi:unnamed protein product [Schistosoma rodhaini]|uniref:MULE transposase domain-containing protein n=2 Tax=Schistosoma rodhaini TaxID=6188 RepID=A0AA85FJA1_9TREM|nr:unnamed protein product [Schistosoma rodhaini]
MDIDNFFHNMDVSNVQIRGSVVPHVVTETENVFLNTLYLVAFPSLEALKSDIRTYEIATYCHFAVRDSNFHGDRKPYIKFVCWRKSYKTTSVSSQPIRRRRTSMDTQCPAFIFCKFLEGYWTVVRGNVHHNHECNSMRYDCNTWMRRLTGAEFESVKPLLISGTSAFNVIHYAYQSYGKRLTAQDVFNMRYKVFSQANLPGDYGKLKNHITSLGGLCDYQLDADHSLLYFFFATADQINLCNRFLDVVGFDGTYKTNNENMFLYHVVALDMNFMAIPVCIAFVSRETSTLLSSFLSFFRQMSNNREVIGIVTDDSPAIAAAITQVYPNSHHLLCRVHLLRNVIKRVSFPFFTNNPFIVFVEATI